MTGDSDDGDGNGGTTFPEQPSPILNAPRDNTSRKGNPSLRYDDSASPQSIRFNRFYETWRGGSTRNKVNRMLRYQGIRMMGCWDVGGKDIGISGILASRYLDSGM